LWVSRLFLRKVKMTLNLPVLGLVDSDPYGTFASRSLATSLPSLLVQSKAACSLLGMEVRCIIGV
jgi:DNA topoisomerase VI subunit A